MTMCFDRFARRYDATLLLSCYVRSLWDPFSYRDWSWKGFSIHVVPSFGQRVPDGDAEPDNQLCFVEGRYSVVTVLNFGHDISCTLVMAGMFSYARNIFVS